MQSLTPRFGAIVTAPCLKPSSQLAINTGRVERALEKYSPDSAFDNPFSGLTNLLDPKDGLVVEFSTPKSGYITLNGGTQTKFNLKKMTPKQLADKVAFIKARGYADCTPFSMDNSQSLKGGVQKDYTTPEGQTRYDNALSLFSSSINSNRMNQPNLTLYVSGFDGPLRASYKRNDADEQLIKLKQNPGFLGFFAESDSDFLLRALDHALLLGRQPSETGVTKAFY